MKNKMFVEHIIYNIQKKKDIVHKILQLHNKIRVLNTHSYIV